MNINKTTPLKSLWEHLSKRRQKQFWLLLFLMIIASLIEVVSLGALLPFLGVLTAPEQIYQHPFMLPLIQVLELASPNQLIFPITIIFVIAVIFSGVVRLILLYIMTRLSFAIWADLSIDIYRRTLYQGYEVHIARNSSEVINGIMTKTNTVIGGVLTPALNFISSIMLIISIMVVLFAINPILSLSAFIGFGFFYLGIVFYTRIQLQKNSQIIADQSTQMIKSLQEGLGGIRDVLIDGSQQFYCNLYRNASLPLSRAYGNNQFIIGSPRYAMEAISMALIAILAYISIQKGGTESMTIPTLGVLALGAQKLLPALQLAYSAYSRIKGSNASLTDVLYLLDQPLVEKIVATPVLFEKSIELTNISFRYTKDTPWILKNINLSLTKGRCIGFIGLTGSGKSTLLDIIMGLLIPTDGELIIDNKVLDNQNRNVWQANIAHVPQNIYLSDSTIEENIAFGIPKEDIDHQKVKKVARQAKISELIEGWKDGYSTSIGERGVRLSGGQRQRIGIARALYKQVSVLILDEATSALDSETEKEVMGAIDALNGELTILIIAHRLTTLKGCDQIVKLDKNFTISTGTYDEIINIKNIKNIKNIQANE